jgi:ferredoxin
MPYLITGECINCGYCIDECVVEAIYEGEELFEIDPEICNDCGDCVEVCPVSAIIHV